MSATKSAPAAKLRTMLACVIIDALDWPCNNDSYDRAKTILDRLDPLTGNLCRRILDAVEHGPARLNELVGRNKYGARPATVDGIRFDSTKESRRYGELRLLEKAGLIRSLEMQPRFPIDVVETWRFPEIHIVHCGVFTADFQYVEMATGEVVIEDTKSGPTKTTAYRLRKRLVEAIHGVNIREV